MLQSRVSSSQSTVGGLPPPPGISVDLDHPDTNLYKINIACQVLCFCIVGSSVLARIYTKAFVKRKVVIEDYSCILAWLLATTWGGMALGLNQYRGGSHQWNVPMNYVIEFLRLQYCLELLYYGAAFFTKTSILCLIARIFAPNRRAVFISRLILSLLALYYTIAGFIKVFRCIPIHKSWDSTVAGNCIASERMIFVADCITSLVSDLAVLILPMPLVWRLKISSKRKLRIMVVFAGGILAVAADMARITQIYTLDGEDATYSTEVIMFWAIAEVNTGLICSCLPVLSAFYQHIFGPASEPRSNLSSYHRLKKTNTSHNDGGLNEAVAQEGLLGLSHVTGGLSLSVQGGRDAAEENEGPWQGGGILKTVDVKQTGLPVSESAGFPRAHLGSTRHL